VRRKNEQVLPGQLPGPFSAVPAHLCARGCMSSSARRCPIAVTSPVACSIQVVGELMVVSGLDAAQPVIGIGPIVRTTARHRRPGKLGASTASRSPRPVRRSASGRSKTPLALGPGEPEAHDLRRASPTVSHAACLERTGIAGNVQRSDRVPLVECAA
jgi:hypothetical protein